MNNKLFDWHETAASTMLIILMAFIVDGTPVIGMNADGQLMFGIIP